MRVLASLELTSALATEDVWIITRASSAATALDLTAPVHAVDAQRRLNTRRADNAPTKAPPLGPRDPRYAYLTESHD